MEVPCIISGAPTAATLFVWLNEESYNSVTVLSTKIKGRYIGAQATINGKSTVIYDGKTYYRLLIFGSRLPANLPLAIAPYNITPIYVQIASEVILIPSTTVGRRSLPAGKRFLDVLPRVPDTGNYISPIATGISLNELKNLYWEYPKGIFSCNITTCGVSDHLLSLMNTGDYQPGQKGAPVSGDFRDNFVSTLNFPEDFFPLPEGYDDHIFNTILGVTDRNNAIRSTSFTPHFKGIFTFVLNGEAPPSVGFYALFPFTIKSGAWETDLYLIDRDLSYGTGVPVFSDLKTVLEDKFESLGTTPSTITVTILQYIDISGDFQKLRIQIRIQTSGANTAQTDWLNGLKWVNQTTFYEENISGEYLNIGYSYRITSWLSPDPSLTGVSLYFVPVANYPNDPVYNVYANITATIRIRNTLTEYYTATFQSEYITGQSAQYSGDFTVTLFGYPVAVIARTLNASGAIVGTITLEKYTGLNWDQLTEGDPLYQKDELVWEL